MLKLSNRFWLLAGLLLFVGLVYGLSYPATEPFFNNDETRHVMTGVYFRDLLHDMPFGQLRAYTVNYYLQYPALGLLVWPPLFYITEGLLMSVFGTSLVVAKSLVAVYALVACAYLFFLVARTHDTTRAAIAVLVFALSPLIFQFSHYVMLELPTVAMGLAATFYFVRYMDEEQRRDLLLAGLFSVLTALTRFDAIYLLPLFVILLVARGRLGILKRKEVWIVAAVAILLVLPFYAMTTASMGWLHFKSVTEQVDAGQPAFFSLKRLFFYPSKLPQQLGWLALVPAVVGIVYSMKTSRRSQTLIYFAIIVSVFLTFTPVAETDSRHTIYWIPAFAFFAAEGIALLTAWLRQPKLYLPLAALLILGMTWHAFSKPLAHMRGYEEAAQYVVANSNTSPFCLFQGHLNGNFVYQVHRHDADRKLWVLRTDKLLFSVLVNAGVEYKQFTENDEEMLATIYKYDPEFILIEETQGAETIPAENHVREVINNHPERFRLEKTFPIESTDTGFFSGQIKVFRNIFRNTNPDRHLNLEILMLRRSLQTDVP
ncbi:MAG: glycosyltransferase family 39 protein [Pyrinomonadaceae bacterium]